MKEGRIPVGLVDTKAGRREVSTRRGKTPMAKNHTPKQARDLRKNVCEVAAKPQQHPSQRFKSERYVSQSFGAPICSLRISKQSQLATVAGQQCEKNGLQQLLAEARCGSWLWFTPFFHLIFLRRHSVRPMLKIPRGRISRPRYGKTEASYAQT